MHFDILTLFPAMFAGPLDESIIKRARERGLISIDIHNIRDYSTDRHHTTDDYPFGGGRGMVMKPEPIFATVEAVLAEHAAPPPDWPRQRAYVPPGSAVVLLTPQGRLLTQGVAGELSQMQHLILVCGRYEGVDERVRLHLATHEISIGDYVLTGGELPAMVLLDCVTRLVPGVLPSETPVEESHYAGLLEYPQYTRPAEFLGWSVPEILLSGHHAAVARWRRCQSLLRTLLRRPELLERADLTAKDQRQLERLRDALENGQTPCE
ncbi:MAG: tRNA (guanosine(37)-N1)-methyltransferase TrmD [Chloroflexi bacterium]|nr:tRNA (guanosine(37)-N1)-methyltransferase TrmD [Chloroflexota bacterium]MCL5108207.1 tRNA (guanosine(37)-N1)-methyltransferase TrmD [Chloroflexota bacterium]